MSSVSGSMSIMQNATRVILNLCRMQIDAAAKDQGEKLKQELRKSKEETKWKCSDKHKAHMPRTACVKFRLVG
jgi:hypothetical protein